MADTATLARLAKHAKGMFVAPPGFQFLARDFSSLEAKLMGAFAGSQRFTRLAALGVHDYFMAHGILKPRRLIADADLPDLKWSDADLRACFKANRERFKGDDGPLSPRQVAKRTIYLSGYLGTPGKMNEEFPESFPTKKDAAIVQGAFFDLFSEIPYWHKHTCLALEGKPESIAIVVKLSCGAVHAGTGWLRAPSGFLHRFYRVLDWKKGPDGVWTHTYSDDAKRAIAFLPQHTGAFAGKRSGKRIYNNHTELANKVQAVRYKAGLTTERTWRPRKIDEAAFGGAIDHPFLRLFIHDEWLCEVPDQYVEEVDEVLRVEMEQPIPEIPLDPSWGMGESLYIATEGKRGQSWGDMK